MTKYEAAANYAANHHLPGDEKTIVFIMTKFHLNRDEALEAIREGFCYWS